MCDRNAVKTSENVEGICGVSMSLIDGLLFPNAESNLIVINVEPSGARTVNFEDGIKSLHPETSSWNLEEVSAAFDLGLDLSSQSGPELIWPKKSQGGGFDEEVEWVMIVCTNP